MSLVALARKIILDMRRLCLKNGRFDAEGVLPYKRLIGMCLWMASHFHDQSEYNGVDFSIDLPECGRKFSDFFDKQGFKMGIFSVKKSESCCLLNLTISSH